MHPRTTQGHRVIYCLPHTLTESLATSWIGGQAEFVGRGLAGPGIEVGTNQLVALEFRRQLIGRNVVRKPKLHRPKAVGRCRRQAFEQGQFRIEQAEVGGEFWHGDPQNG